jgi:hypothetical protein
MSEGRGRITVTSRRGLRSGCKQALLSRAFLKIRFDFSCSSPRRYRLRCRCASVRLQRTLSQVTGHWFEGGICATTGLTVQSAVRTANFIAFRPSPRSCCVSFCVCVLCVCVCARIFFRRDRGLTTVPSRDVAFTPVGSKFSAALLCFTFARVVLLLRLVAAAVSPCRSAPCVSFVRFQRSSGRDV